MGQGEVRRSVKRATRNNYEKNTRKIKTKGRAKRQSSRASNKNKERGVINEKTRVIESTNWIAKVSTNSEREGRDGNENGMRESEAKGYTSVPASGLSSSRRGVPGTERSKYGVPGKDARSRSGCGVVPPDACEYSELTLVKLSCGLLISA